MIKSCGVDRWLGGLQDFSVSPIPLETNWVLELIGTLLGFRDRAWQYDQMKVIPRILVQIGPT